MCGETVSTVANLLQSTFEEPADIVSSFLCLGCASPCPRCLSAANGDVRHRCQTLAFASARFLKKDHVKAGRFFIVEYLTTLARTLRPIAASSELASFVQLSLQDVSSRESLPELDHCDAAASSYTPNVLEVGWQTCFWA